jgi:hypothetical protein
MARSQGFKDFLMAINEHPELSLDVNYALSDNMAASIEAGLENLSSHVFSDFLTIKPTHEFELWKDNQKLLIASHSFIFELQHT